MALVGSGGPELATPPAIARRVAPDAGLAGAFAEAHARYTATYKAIRELS